MVGAVEVGAGEVDVSDCLACRLAKAAARLAAKRLRCCCVSCDVPGGWAAPLDGCERSADGWEGPSAGWDEPVC